MAEYDEMLRASVEQAEGPIIASVHAEKFVAEIREKNPHLLAAWLDDNATTFTTDRVGVWLRSERGKALHGRSATQFGKAAGAFAEGDEDAFHSILDVRYEIDEEHSQLRLREMRKPHLLFAADQYDVRARANALRSAFLRAVAKKAGAKTVGDVFDEQSIDRLWRSLNGSDA